MGSGFFCGDATPPPDGDFRNHNPKFSSVNLAANRKRFAPLLALAKAMEITPAQLALAWLLHQGLDIIPIPGTRKAERVLENARAAGIILDDPVVLRINNLAKHGMAKGAALIEA